MNEAGLYHISDLTGFSILISKDNGGKIIGTSLTTNYLLSLWCSPGIDLQVWGYSRCDAAYSSWGTDRKPVHRQFQLLENAVN